jgi:hypothetical protein
MELQTSQTLGNEIQENSRWEVTLSTREKFMLTGNQYKALDMVTKGTIQPQLVRFPKFSINIAHIVSIICDDEGFTRLEAPDKLKDTDPNPDALDKLRDKIGKLK